jgi:hypothetical protein
MITTTMMTTGWELAITTFLLFSLFSLFSSTYEITLNTRATIK